VTWAVLALAAAAWLDVPFVRQEKNGCGAAAAAMVIQYWQRNGASVPDGAADPQAIRGALYSKAAAGIYASDLAAYFERSGFRAFAFRGAWADLAGHLDKGRPLIVSLGGARAHFVVIAGVDRDRELVFVHDPAERRLMKLDRAAFERSWRDRWTLLAVPRQNE
jgi:ABC-type bacteriocin/lantibiotic exporter with double-glycine peptidase domain